MRRKGRVEFSILLIFIIVLSLGLRIYQLGTYGLWWDEVVTTFQAENLRLLPNYLFTTPPLIMILLHFWKYLGESDFTLRLLPMIFGVLSILLIYKLGRLLFSQEVGLISAFLLCISPFHIYYSQELRPYSLFTFMALGSLYYLIRILKKDKLSLWLGYVIFTALSLYTHYFFFFILLSEYIIFIFLREKRPKSIKKWLLAQSSLVLVYLPWLQVFLKKQLFQAANLTAIYILQPSLEAIPQTFKDFSLGYSATKIQYPFALLTFGLPLVLSFLSLKENRRSLAILWCFLLVPIVLALMLSRFSPIYQSKSLIASSTAYYLILAVGMSSIRKKAIKALMIMSIAILLIPSVYNHYLNNTFQTPGVYPKKGLREATLYIKSNFKPGDVIGHSECVTYVPFKYYFPQRQSIFNFYGSNTLTFSLLSTCREKYPNLYKVYGDLNLVDIEEFIRGKERIWVVLPYWQSTFYLPQFMHSHLKLTNWPRNTSLVIRDWLDGCCKEIDCKNFSDVVVILYTHAPSKSKDDIFTPIADAQPKKGLKEAAQYINSNFEPGDVIGHSGFVTYVPFKYYFLEKQTVIDYCGINASSLSLLESKKEQLPGFYEQIRNVRLIDIEEFVAEGSRIWVIYPSRQFGLKLMYWPNFFSSLVKEQMDRHCKIIDCNSFFDVEVILYEKAHAK